MASTSGNKNINVVVVLCFILLITFSSSAEDSADKKYIKFPPNSSLGDGNPKIPANPYHRACLKLTRCRGSVRDQP
ncbi:hypothetical protein P3L10_000362 [Capsicum annuum]